jgi:hypothetical protein
VAFEVDDDGCHPYHSVSIRLGNNKTYTDRATGCVVRKSKVHEVACFGGLGKPAADAHCEGGVVTIIGRLRLALSVTVRGCCYATCRRRIDFLWSGRATLAILDLTGFA